MSYSPSKLMGHDSSFQASLHFPVYVLSFNNSPSLSDQEQLCIPPSNDIQLEEIDILDPKDDVVYIFDPTIFDATKTNDTERKNIKKKLFDSLIEKASLEGGQSLVSNGSYRWGRGQKFKYYSLACSRFRTCHKQPSERLDTKNASLNNCRKKNSRIDGNKKEPKRTSTSLPLTKDTKCRMQIRVKCNDRCFFYIPSSKCMHEGHPHECDEDVKSKGKRVLNSSEEESRKKMSRTKTSGGGTSTSVGMFREHGVMMSRQYLHNKSRKDPINNNPGSITKAQMMSTNDAESIRDHLIASHKCRVVILRAKSSVEDSPTISMESSIDNAASPNTQQSQSITSIDPKEVDEYLQTTEGRNRDLNLLALAFANRQQYQLARTFCSTISIDSTHKACQIDNLSLLTVTVKDAFGLTSVILSFWIPNQRTWMFKYVLLEILPKIFGSQFCLKVKAIISDGDKQLIRSIELSIDRYYRNAIRLPCTWHIVHPPLRNGHRTIGRRPHVSKYWLQWFLRLLQKWVYTFMKSNCGIESDEEYRVSKSLLSAFVNSDTIKKYLTNDGVLAVKQYLEDSIFTYEDTFLAYKKLHLHNKEREDNCAHEGTNFARKYMDDCVLPSDSIMSATEKLATYDDLVMYERKQLCFNEFRKVKLHTKRWKHLTTYYVGIVKQEEKLAEDTEYIWEYDSATKSIYVMDSNTFEANQIPDQLPDDNLQELFQDDFTEEASTEDASSDKDSKHTIREIRRMKTSDLLSNMNEGESEGVKQVMKEFSGLVARFRRSRKVQVEIEGQNIYFTCSCGFYDRSGVICRHLFFLEKSLFPSLKLESFTYRNIHVTCYSSYSYLASREDDLSPDEQSLFDHLSKQAQEDPTSVCVCSKEEDASQDSTTTIFDVLSTMNDDTKSSNISPKEYYSLPAVDRLLNYSRTAAIEARNSVGNVDDLNYNVEFSQNETAFSQNNLNEEFEIGLSQSNADESNPKFMKTEIQKDFFEMLNTIGSRNSHGYKILARHMLSAREELLQYNLSQQTSKIDSALTYFPNSSFGNKTKDKISKKYK